MNKGKLIIFSAPSGSGKTTIVRHLLQKGFPLEFSVSATSRKPRGNEINGKDYYFITAAEFREKINNDEFLEWEEVYPDQYYGSLKSEVERIRNTGKHVVFDVDVIGGCNIKKYYDNEALSVFIQPPSVEVLKQRLSDRSTDAPEVIQIRIEKAAYELSFAPQFDVVIINDQLDEALLEAETIVSKFLAE